MTTFLSGFYDESRQDDILKLTPSNLQKIGIASRNDIREFEQMVKYVKANPSGKKFTEKEQSVYNEFMVQSTIIQKDPVIITSADVAIGEALGSGQFGKVFKGFWKRKTDKGEQIEIPVALKTISDACEMSWKKEVSIFTSLNQSHSSIIKFYGLLIGERDEVRMVTEFAAFGSLLERLRERAITSIALLAQFAVQIASGMIYLHNSNLVHRDLSARNILVTAKNQVSRISQPACSSSTEETPEVKVSDFGLSKIISESEKEWVMESKELLPIRWLSPESYKNGVFTTASDVWSYAVCLWEMFTFGDVPWPNCNNDQVKEKLENGDILPEPQMCPFGFYEVMQMCFHEEAEGRPSFRIIHELLVEIQPELLEVFAPSTGQYDLTAVKGDLVNAIKPLDEPDLNIWLCQHATSLLFGRFDRKLTEPITSLTPENTEDMKFFKKNMSKEMKTVNIKPQIESEKYVISEKNIENKENEPIRLDEPNYRVINTSNISTEWQHKNELINGAISYQNLATTSTNSSCIDDRPNAFYQKMLQKDLIEYQKQNEPQPQLLFEDTNPVAQETVNDRISRNWLAFLNATEEKTENDKNYDQKSSEFLNPVDVSTKPPLETIINSIDPYAKVKSQSQENLYSTRVKAIHEYETLTRSSDDIGRPRPKPSTQKHSNLTARNAYASSIRNDLQKDSEKLKDNPQSVLNKRLPDALEQKKVSTNELQNLDDVRNRQYLLKFAHIIPASSQNNKSNNKSDTSFSQNNTSYPVDTTELNTETDSSHFKGQPYSSHRNQTKIVNELGKEPKHFTYNPNKTVQNMKELPASQKELNKIAVSNHMSNDWHLFEDCVKDNKKMEKLKRRTVGNEISWPLDASKMTQAHKEEFSSKFQKIRSIVPGASITECLEALRYSKSDIKKSVTYIQIQKLMRDNIGFSFERCEKVLTECKGNYDEAHKFLTIEGIRLKFVDTDNNYVKTILEASRGNLKLTLENLFLKECDKIGFNADRGKRLLRENDSDVVKALEVAKILHVAEITSKPEQDCFRTLTNCQWKVDIAVESLLA